MKALFAALGAAIICTACTSSGSNRMTVEEGAQEDCRMMDVSGSILREKVCHNKATWAAIEEREKEDADRDLQKLRDRRGEMPRDTGM